VQKGKHYPNCSKISVTPYDIYQLNPDAQSGLKPNSILISKQLSKKKTTDKAVLKNKFSYSLSLVPKKLYMEPKNV
jgi:hypothetical protein